MPFVFFTPSVLAANASGAVASISLSGIAATATGAANVLVTAAAISFAGIAGSGTGGANASGAVSVIAIQASPGTATGGSSSPGNAGGQFACIAIAAKPGTASGVTIVTPNTLLEAIRDRILAAASMATLGQEVYNRKTPAKTRIVFPCCVVNTITEDEADIFAGGDYYAGWVETQVTILDTDETEGTFLRDQCYKLFRPTATPLLFVDGTTSGTIPGRKWEWDQPGNGPGGTTVWAAGFRMRHFVTRTML